MLKQPKSVICKNRRAFLHGLVAAAAVPTLPALPETVWAVLPSPSGAAQQPPSPQVAALTELVRLRYGRYLDQRDMPVLERGLERIARTPEQLLKVKLANSDAPDCLFLPDAP